MIGPLLNPPGMYLVRRIPPCDVSDIAERVGRSPVNWIFPDLIGKGRKDTRMAISAREVSVR